MPWDARQRLSRARFIQNYVMEPWQRVEWPRRPVPRVRDSRRVAIVTVNYNTLEFIAMLLFSLFRVLGRDAFQKIVVVDNGSEDQSVPVLQVLQRHGLIELLINSEQRYHGPALNQALSHLARQNHHAGPDSATDYVWVVDSDIICLRRDAISRPVAFLQERGAAMVGEFEYETLSEGYAQLWSLLIDPELVCRCGIPPFHEDGAPGRRMQQALRTWGLGIHEYPYGRGRYVLHIGSATVNVLAKRQISANRYYEWARAWQGLGLGYRWRAHGPSTYLRFLQQFQREVPELTGWCLLQACEKRDLLTTDLGRQRGP